MTILHRSVVQGTILWATMMLLAGCSANPGGNAVPTDGSAAGLSQLLQEQLAAELDRLGVDPAKKPALAPQSPANGVFYIYAVVNDPDGLGGQPADSVELGWVEQCIGDYDQNGEVNISDLTPLGQNFSAQVRYDPPTAHMGYEFWPSGNFEDGKAAANDPAAPGSPAHNWRLARVDGDRNGELNIGDVTPIAQHWAERLDGYKVYRRRPGEADFSPLPDPANPGSEVTVSRPTFSNNRPVVYSFTDADLGAAPAGLFQYYVAPYDASSGIEGMLSSTVFADLDAGGGGALDPVAILAAKPASGPAGTEVSFDAGDSIDIDGTITKFEWDMDGNPTTWEYDSGLDPVLKITVNDPVGYTQRVRVTDNEGRTATAEAAFATTTGGNQPPQASFIATPDTGEAPLIVDFDASASVDTDGTIVQYDWDPEGNGTFPGSTATPVYQYTYATDGTFSARLRVLDNEGAQQITTVTVTVTPTTQPIWHNEDPSGAGGTVRALAMTMINGFPAVAWMKDSDTSIHYMYGADGVAKTWGTDRQVGNYNYTPGNIALINVNGKPGIVYYNPTDAFRGSLEFVLGDDASGTTFKPVRTILQNVNASFGLDGEMVDGVPAITFRAFAETNTQFLFSRAIDAEGTVWAGTVQIEPNPTHSSGYDCDLEIVDGRPAVYSQGIYYRAATASGSDWAGVGSLRVVVGAGRNSSLEVVDGNPADCYYTFGGANQWLYYVRSTEGIGSAWPAPVLLDVPASDRSDNYGNDCALGVFSGKPFVAYLNETQPALNVMFALDAAGTSWGPAEVVKSGFCYKMAVGANVMAPLVAYTPTYGFEVAAKYAEGTIL